MKFRLFVIETLAYFVLIGGPAYVLLDHAPGWAILPALPVMWIFTGVLHRKMKHAFQPEETRSCD